MSTKFWNLWNFIDENILLYLDFLHYPTTFPITKNATKSYFGIFLSFIMIVICILEFFHDYNKIGTNYSVTFEQDLISKNVWNNKTVTLGFNVSKEFENNVTFKFFDSYEKNISSILEKCDENLSLIKGNEIPTYYCLIDYQLNMSNNSDYALKVDIALNNKRPDNEVKIPFYIAIKEVIIQHDNKDNPLNRSMINIIKSFFGTIEKTTFRRNLKLINYKTKGWFYEEKEFNDIYLDDFEDSRKRQPKGSENLIGSFRLMTSKKMDVYRREYVSKTQFLSNLGGFISIINTSFIFLTLFLVNPNDNYRIFNYLKKKKSINLDKDSETIFYYGMKKNNKTVSDLNYNDFNRTVMDNRCFSKFWNKTSYLLCRFCKCNKRTERLSIITDYINENLTVENYLENQILTKKINERMDKLDRLKVDYGLKYIENQNELRELYHEDRVDSFEEIGNNENLSKTESLIDKEKKKKMKHMNTIYCDDSSPNSFNEKQKEDITKIVLELLNKV